jgi:hypothetical protein
MHRRSKRILTGLGIIVVVLAVTYAVLLIRATAKLRQAYAALAADGRPMQAAEILPPRVSDGDNAAVLYQSAILLLKGQPAGDKSLYERLTNYRLRPKTKPEINDLLRQEAVDRALSLVEQGTRRPACQFERDRDHILRFPDIPAMDGIRDLAWIIRARTSCEAETGHPVQAWDMVLMQLRFADSLRLDPASSTQYTRLSLAVGACRTIQSLCETAPPDREHAQAIEALLARQDNIDLLIRGVDGERLLIGEWFFGRPREELDKVLWAETGSHENDALPPALGKALYRLGFQVIAFKPRLVTDHAAYLDLMRKRVDLLRGPYRNRKEFDQYLETSRWNILAQMLAGGSYGLYVYRREVADLRLTRAGLALLQYQRTHGRFPETLEALGPGEWPDPFTDHPLHYRPENEGFLVYSVGEDGTDNNGTPKPEKEEDVPRSRRKPVAYDQLWRFPAPKTQAASGN